jgi:hypothetical protein
VSAIRKELRYTPDSMYSKYRKPEPTRSP